MILVLALFAANLPFINERLFGLLPIPFSTGRPAKSLWWRVLELIILYGVIGFLGRFLEGRIGTVFEQHWEFYAISGVLFVVFAYPGFAFRYLRKRHG